MGAAEWFKSLGLMISAFFGNIECCGWRRSEPVPRLPLLTAEEESSDDEEVPFAAMVRSMMRPETHPHFEVISCDEDEDLLSDADDCGVEPEEVY